MSTLRSALVATLVVATGVLLTACTASEAEPEEPSGSRSAAVGVAGTAPVMFAFTCRTGSGDETQSYTTYSAVWADRRDSCTATRTTGSELSAQQSAAVRAADGDASLEQLAAGCAVRGAGAWVAPVATPAEAHRAAGLLAYCPGHPERDHLQEALATYRG